MGIFLRLFVLLEEDCHKLDCRADVVLDRVSVISYDNYCAALVTKRELMDEMVSLKDKINALNSMWYTCYHMVKKKWMQL